MATESFSLTTAGGDALRDKWRLLPEKVAKKAARKGITKGSQRVNKTAKVNVVKRTKLLDKSLGYKVKTYPSGNTVGIIGPRRGFRVKVTAIQKKRVLTSRLVVVKGKLVQKSLTLVNGRKLNVGDFIDPVKYAHLVEGGHKRGKGKSAAQAKPFLIPAFRVEKRNAVSDLNDAIREALKG